MKTYAHWLFGLAAAFNALVGLAMLLGRPLLGPMLGLAPLVGTNIAIANLAAGLILTFAYAYLRVAMDPVRFRPFIGLAVIGKLLAVACVVWPWLAGDIDARLPRLVAGDFVFALLFADYLRRTGGRRDGVLTG